MSDEQVVLTEVKGHTMIITLNRPKSGNAITPEVAQAVDAAFEQAENNPDIYVVIVTGAGDRIFCAGMDLKFLATHSMKEVAGTVTKHGFAGLTERKCSMPVICAVNGAAMGGGTEIALACDLVVADENATFGLPEVKTGILAGAGGPVRLAKQLPRAAGMEMVLTGAKYTAQQAKDMFLVNRVAPAGQVIDEALKLANEIASNAPISVRCAKELFNYSLTHTMEESMQKSNEITAYINTTEDAKEGPRAFAEKRAPVWQGK